MDLPPRVQARLACKCLVTRNLFKRERLHLRTRPMRPVPCHHPVQCFAQRCAAAASQARPAPGSHPASGIRPHARPALRPHTTKRRRPRSLSSAPRSTPPSAHRPRPARSCKPSHTAPHRSIAAAPPASDIRPAAPAHAATAESHVACRIGTGSPAAKPRTRSGISRSADQSPPPITLPARAVATRHLPNPRKSKTAETPPRQSPRTPSSSNTDHTRPADPSRDTPTTHSLFS